MRVVNIPNIIPASTVLNTTVNSAAIPLYQIFGYAIQIVFTGTPTGSFKLQASCDSVPQVVASGIFIPTNWTDISGSSQAVSVSGNIIWNAEDTFYNYVRVVYTDGSSGASTAIVTVSTFNGHGI